MDLDLNTKLEGRNKGFLNSYDDDLIKYQRSQNQLELRRNKRSEAAFKQRKLREFEIEWIEIGKSPNQKYFLEDLDELVLSLKSSDRKVNLMGIYGIRKLLSQSIPSPVEKVMDSGAVIYIIPCLYRDDCPQIQYEAAWAITNMCTGSHEHIKSIIEKGCLKGLYHMLKSSVTEVKEQSIWALGNIAADSGLYRDIILKSEALESLINIVLSSQSTSLVKQGCWGLSNICRTKPHPPPEILMPALPALAKGLMLHNQMNEIVADILWSFGCLTENSYEVIQKVISLDILQLIVSFARSQSYTNALPALKILGNIIGGTDQQTDYVIKYGGLKALKESLSVQLNSIKKEAIWAISNLCAGTFNQLETLMNSGIMKILIEMAPDETIEVQKEIAWSFGNITSNDSYYLDSLLNDRIIYSLCSLLKCKDSSVILVTLMSIEKILAYYQDDIETFRNCQQQLEENQGLDLIYALQHHKNSKIYEKATNILGKFFETENEYQTLVDSVKELSNYIL